MRNNEVKNFYNTVIGTVYQDSYEHERWFSSPLRKAQYVMTMRALHRVLFSAKPDANQILEIGPGAGTWTAELLKEYPRAEFTLLDISREMLALSRKRFSDNLAFTFIEEDLLMFAPAKRFDLLFASRIIEYIADKDRVAKKCATLLAPGGIGYIVTKMPHYRRARLLGRTTADFHSTQISPWKLRDHFEANGCRVIKITGVTFAFPLLKSAQINRLVARMLGGRTLGPITALFAESYAILFEKL